MGTEKESAPRFPARKPPPVLFPPPPSQKGYRPPPYEPLLSRYRGKARDAGGKGVERYLVMVESFLPDPSGALERLLLQQAGDGAALFPNWQLSAKALGDAQFSVAFTPAPGRERERAWLASGTFGSARVEIAAALAHGAPHEEERLRASMAAGAPFEIRVRDVKVVL